MINRELADLVELVLYRADIVEIVDSHTKLDRRNQAKCPFCHAAGATLIVDPEGQYFSCSECNIEGDAIEFLRDIYHDPFWLVVENLAKQVGVATGSLSTLEEEPLDDLECTRYSRMRAHQYYESKLLGEYINYLRDLGITYQTMTRFRIGYAPGDLQEHFGDEKILRIESAVEAGLLTRRNNGSIRDFFEDRIIFPNLMYGKVVSLNGLAMHGEEPKYLRIPDPIVSLYNESALRRPEVILVETPLDCLSAEQQGFPSASLIGTSLPPEFIPRVSRCRVVYVCMKGDSRGMKAALAIGEAIGGKSRIVKLPNALNLVEYLKDHSKEEFEKLLAEAQAPLETEIELIDPNLAEQDRDWRLIPILRRMAQLDENVIDTLIFRNIGSHFKLGDPTLHSYRRLIHEHRSGGVNC